MQNKRKLTASFRKIFRKGASIHEKELFARWFSQLDISEGPVFRDQAEEDAIEKKIQLSLHDHVFGQAPAKVFRLPSWLPATAAAVLLIAVGVWWFASSQIKHQPTFAIAVTHAGERKIITLSDGSIVTLNNSSTLKFQNEPTGTRREVLLNGEAFFEVAHDDKKPFIVKTANLNVQVLGTSFNVQSYTAGNSATVTVATGKVGITTKEGGKTWMLTPGHQLIYDASTGKADENNVDANDYTAWQKGELIFKNEKLEDICRRLERWYGVTIVIKTPLLGSKRINLKPRNESLNTVLKMLGMVGGFNYNIQGKAVQIW